MSAFGQTDLQRFRFWQGQMLASRDFRDQSSLDARRRLLHNRALHGVSGVCFGLGAAVDATDPSTLTVDCGVAYDCAGRELILQRRRSIQIPASPATLILRRRLGQPENSCCLPTDPGCAPAGRFDVEQDLELVWQTGPLDPLGVVLSRTHLVNAVLQPDAAFRPVLARPIARPHLSRGETVRGNTPWENWEVAVPDGQGGFRQQVVGVQTHIDTSAAGFTEVPDYFASLVGPAWNLENVEFAPTVFPQVADASVDGFTFRLLMVATARRRYNAVASAGRVAQVTRLAGDQMRLQVENASVFRTNDAVALLRPRGEAACFVEEQDGLTLKLHASLPASVVPNQTILAVGSVPRVAKIESVTGNQTILATYESATTTLKRNDVLVRIADNAVTTVDGVSAAGGVKVAIVRQPFSLWKKEEQIGFALAASATGVDSADAGEDPSIVIFNLKTADATITVGSAVVLTNAKKKPLSSAAPVVKVDGVKVSVRTPADLVSAAGVKFVSPVKTDISVVDLKPQSSGVTVKISPAGRLLKGDYVAATTDLAHATVVDDVDASGEELTLRDTLILAGVPALVAANFVAATTVDQPPNAFTPLQVVVGREGAVPQGAFVVRVDSAGMSDPVRVALVSGRTVTLEKTMDGLTRLDTLAAGVFPRVVTVVHQDDPASVRIEEANALRAGDIVARMSPSADPEPVVEVAGVTGNLVQFRQPFSGLATGEQLGVVNFRDTVLLTAAPNPKEAPLDHDIQARDGDFVAVLTHYADNSNLGSIQQISGNQLTLRPDGIGAGDGIVQRDWIDGGILGPAAIRFPEQPLVRLESIEGLENVSARQDTATGFDPVIGQFHSSSVTAFVVEALVNRVALIPIPPVSGSFVYRPETFSLLTTFNAGFPRAFAVFAQKQQLSVAWFGCQQERRQTPACPAQTTVPETCEGCNSSQD